MHNNTYQAMNISHKFLEFLYIFSKKSHKNSHKNNKNSPVNQNIDTNTYIYLFKVHIQTNKCSNLPRNENRGL